jgi:cytochrome c oxidase subunit II
MFCDIGVKDCLKRKDSRRVLVRSVCAVFMVSLLVAAPLRAEDSKTPTLSDSLKDLDRGLDLLSDAQSNPADDPDLTVRVTGEQFTWKFTFPLESDKKGVTCVSSNGFAVPKDAKVNMVITSNDVIHELVIPGLSFRAEGVPGRLNSESLDTFKPGTYTGGASAISGSGFERMVFEIHVLSPDAYARWVEKQAASPSCAKD